MITYTEMLKDLQVVDKALDEFFLIEDNEDEHRKVIKAWDNLWEFCKYTNEKCSCLKGFVLSNNEDGDKDLQRCDACDVFADDEEAKQYVLAFIKNIGKHY